VRRTAVPVDDTEHFMRAFRIDLYCFVEAMMEGRLLPASLIARNRA